jgi:transcription-repair coupling factor (superfamily II helicase)
MTYRQGKALTEISAKRLSAIREYAEFGSASKSPCAILKSAGRAMFWVPSSLAF